MSRSTTLEPRAKEVIIQQMEELGEMTTEEVMDLIRPHYSFDICKAKEQAIKRKANQLISQLRDEKGIRTCFNCNLDGVSTYINIDSTTDSNALTEIENQLNKKYLGLNESKKKVAKRRQEISGQLKLDLAI